MAVAPLAPLRALVVVIEVTHDTGQEFGPGRRITSVYPAPREPMRTPARLSWGSLVPASVTNDVVVG